MTSPGETLSFSVSNIENIPRGTTENHLQERLQKIKQFAGRTLLSFSLAISGGVIPEIVEGGAQPSYAATSFSNDYPHMDAPCYPPSIKRDVDGNEIGCNDYDWRVPTRDPQGNITSWPTHTARGFWARNCTDGAAYWALKYTGVSIPGTWDDAKLWDTKASSYTVKAGSANNIEPGDIAQSDDGAYGHVGFVTEVSKDSNGAITSVKVAEMNKSATGAFTHTPYSSKNVSGNFIRWGSNDWDHFIDVNGAGKGLNNEDLPGGTTPAVKYDDFMIYRPTGGGTWFAKAGQNGANQINSAWGVMHGGWNGDKPFVGDFNGDGYDDYGIYRLEGGAGTWYVKSSARGEQTAIWGSVHGSPGDIPVVGDMDGDNFADFGIYRIDSNGTGRWYFKSGRTGQPTPVWGWDHGGTGDIPVVGDMNNDGVDDYGIYRVDAANQVGYWYFKSGGDGRQTPVWGWTQGGQPGDIPVVGKFTTDNVDDFGIYRVNPTNSTGYWYMKSGGNGQNIPEAWGVTHGSPGDVPLVGEFN